VFSEFVAINANMDRKHPMADRSRNLQGSSATLTSFYDSYRGDVLAKVADAMDTGPVKVFSINSALAELHGRRRSIPKHSARRS